MYEHVYSGGLNFTQKLAMGNINPEIKSGLLIENKDRSFSARNIGFAMSNASQFNWNLPYVPIDTLFLDKNINYTDGIKVDEATNLQDSYDASNSLLAGYLGINIPVNKFKIYGGLRVEKNRQIVNGFNDDGSPLVVDNDYLDLFPSVNMSYDITSKSLVRFAYGRTVNRPEFREIAPFVFYNFEEKATYYGNTELVNSYINNFDIRYEIFPSTGDMITLGGFYKHFESPIEAHLINAGSGLNYNYDNAKSAQSFGVELDMRKSLRCFGKQWQFPENVQGFCT